MAKDEERDEERADEQPDEERPRRARKGVVLGGGMLALVAVAYVASLVAVPSVPERQELQGPFVAELSTEQVSVNLSGGGNKNFLAMSMRAEYVTFEPDHVLEHIQDPLFQARLTDTVISIASRRTKEELVGDVGKESLKAELAEAIDPLLFPVVVGDARAPSERDEESGLAAGRSMRGGTMRGWWTDHVVHVDGQGRTVRLDDGELVPFEGHETDLAVTGVDGAKIFLDVSRVDPGFEGEVRVGVLGKLRGIYFGKFLVQ